jgi:hypothetical protein
MGDVEDWVANDIESSGGQYMGFNLLSILQLNVA